jgi:hypothetical protein
VSKENHAARLVLKEKRDMRTLGCEGQETLSMETIFRTRDNSRAIPIKPKTVKKEANSTNNSIISPFQPIPSHQSYHPASCECLCHVCHVTMVFIAAGMLPFFL